jgi:TolB-like protein
MEIAPPIVPQRHRFALDQRQITGEAADGLTDGITENLTTDLSRLNGSLVIA